MKFNEILMHSGLSIAEFSRTFHIPYATLQNWKYGTRKCPEYLKTLLIYKLKKEGKWRE